MRTAPPPHSTAPSHGVPAHGWSLGGLAAVRQFCLRGFAQAAPRPARGRAYGATQAGPLKQRLAWRLPASMRAGLDPHRCRPQRARGFTLIELLITLAILAVLATAVLPVAELAMQRQKEQELRLALREIRAGIDAYKRAYDEGRMLRSVNATGYPPTLDILVDGVEDVKNPKRSKMYFLRRVPRDPLDTNPDTPAADTWAKRSYASEAAEPKEGEDVYDVMSKSTKTGLNGLAYSKW